MVKCKLCGLQYRKESNVSFHKFPKDPILRKKWVDACKLHKFAVRHPDQLLQTRICSQHFDDNSYIPYNITGIPRLKPDAVPKLEKCDKQKRCNILKVQTINISEQDMKPKYLFVKSSDNIKDLTVMDEVFTMEEKDKLDLCDRNTEQSIPIIMNDVSMIKEEELDLCNEDTEYSYTITPIATNEVITEEENKLDLCDENAECIPIVIVEGPTSEWEDKLCDENVEQCTSIIEQTSDITEYTEYISIDIKEENEAGKNVEEEDVKRAIKKRKIWRPANIVQLTEEHFVTSNDRKLNLSMVKRKFQQQKKMLASLQKQNSRLIKKVEVYSDFLHKLKDQKLIKEDVAKMLLMYYNAIFQIKSLRKK